MEHSRDVLALRFFKILQDLKYTETDSAAEAPHHSKGCELTGALYCTHKSGESGEKALVWIPSPGGKISPLSAVKQDFHSLSDKFIWKEDGERELKEEGGAQAEGL